MDKGTVNPKELAATRDQKPRLDLLEHCADVQIARALASGSDKYGVANYRDTAILARVYGGAIRRHIGQWLAGQDIDPDSGESHLAMIGSNIHVLLGAIDAGTFVDDRGPAKRTPEQQERSDRSNREPNFTAGEFATHSD